MSYGDFKKDTQGKEMVFPAGVITGLNPASIKVDAMDPGKITESVKYAWYKEKKPVHPYNGEQVFNLDKKGAYSFVKAPRYNDKPMEVGPLARMIIALPCLTW
jgi:hydrogenase large subunit